VSLRLSTRGSNTKLTSCCKALSIIVKKRNNVFRPPLNTNNFLTEDALYLVKLHIILLKTLTNFQGSNSFILSPQILSIQDGKLAPDFLDTLLFQILETAIILNFIE
jgi:hypothetical protein